MKCPVCGTWTLVKETRQRAENAKYRRYECANEHRSVSIKLCEIVVICGHRNQLARSRT
jgi:hypothetical protein